MLAETLSAQSVGRSLRLGGTSAPASTASACTRWASARRGWPAAVGLMRAVKQALDPKNISESGEDLRGVSARARPSSSPPTVMLAQASTHAPPPPTGGTEDSTVGPRLPG